MQNRLVCFILDSMREIYKEHLPVLVITQFVTLLLLGLLTGCGSATTITEVDAETAKEIADQRRGQPDFIILDIRTPKEFRTGHIKGAINVDYNKPNFQDNLNKLDKNTTYLLYCRSGGRTGRSLSVFRKLLFKDIIHLTHGIRSWKEHALPLVKGY